MTQDKRINDRIPVKIIAECEIGKTGFPSFEHSVAFTRDISLQGARLVTPNVINVGEYIDLILKVPTSFLPLLITSKVIWSKRITPEYRGEQEEVELGIKFLRMAPFDQEKLEEFLGVKARGLEVSNV